MTALSTLGTKDGKAIPEKGEVEKKNTVSDYLPEEQKRQQSLQCSIAPLEYKNYKFNFLDLPGNDDFVSEIIGVTRIIKGAVLVIDASVGVQVGTVKHWQRLKRRGIPTLIYLNKMDKEGVDFEERLAEIREKLGHTAIPFGYPLGKESHFDGFINCVDMKARVYNGKECVDAPIYEDKMAKAEELHGAVVEEVAKTNDEMLEKYFAGETFSTEEIHESLRQCVLKGELTPVLVGSASLNIDRGAINLIKVNSGTIKIGDDVYMNGETQKVSALFSVKGKELTPVNEINAGDIGAITKLDDAKSTMTICDPKSIVIYKPVKYPSAVLFKAIELTNKANEAKLGPALQKIQLEDPCVEVVRNNETKQLLLGGVSSSHVDFVIQKLKDTYKVELKTSPMKVVYRESIKGAGEAEGRYVKQSGGSGFYGVVTMRFQPSKENEFAEEVFGGAVPKNYFPAVEKGFFEALQSGPLAGFPVIGVKGVLTDGKYHPVDSNEQAFRMAAILAFKAAYDKCKPIILEPIMKIKVNCDPKYTGNIISDLSTRRARIQGMEEEDGSQVIEAYVPEAEIVDYATQLKSLTQANGYFNREFYSYEEVPEYLKDQVIAANKITE